MIEQAVCVVWPQSTTRAGIVSSSVLLSIRQTGSNVPARKAPEGTQRAAADATDPDWNLAEPQGDIMILTLCSPQMCQRSSVPGTESPIPLRASHPQARESSSFRVRPAYQPNLCAAEAIDVDNGMD
jgi:hypothetical protein